ncbi:MAG: phosphoglucosamine mutase [Bacteroidales bacterium]|nr:phosphoglucosamine mutase [Bacteroidales bacterium]
MTLIKSISGIRGTIGGVSGENLTPLDIVKFVSAYGQWIKQRTGIEKPVVTLGRDARISGEMFDKLVSGTLTGIGIDVINLGLATTPTVEIAVTETRSHGGIILTASHNPRQWNALKLLNESGEFLSAADGEKILELAEKENFVYANIDSLGKISYLPDFEDVHIKKILELQLVDKEAITKAGFRVAIDCVNSVGGLIIPKLLNALGVKEVIKLYCDANGEFPHNPEPLPEHLGDISEAIVKNHADLGFVVDPDVDRLAIVNEDGTMFGEEYTLVSVADYILHHTPGNTVSNLSSTKALKEITEGYKKSYAAAAVGEVNVVTRMKETDAVIGGEGNGGVIYPELHYGRDALVGIALFLTYLAKSGLSCSKLRAKYPRYIISKNKTELKPQTNVDKILELVKEKFDLYPINTEDGVKIEFPEGWVHLRKSNTEPIIRIYSEGNNEETAGRLADKIISVINSFI